MNTIKSSTYDQLHQDKKRLEAQIHQIDKELALRNSQQKNNKNLAKKICELCNVLIPDKFTNLPITIRGGKWKPHIYNFSYRDNLQNYSYAVSVLYSVNDIMYKGFLFDDKKIYYMKNMENEQYLLTDDKYNDTYLMYLIFYTLLNENATNYKKLPEEFFPIHH